MEIHCLIIVHYMGFTFYFLTEILIFIQKSQLAKKVWQLLIECNQLCCVSKLSS